MIVGLHGEAALVTVTWLLLVNLRQNDEPYMTEPFEAAGLGLVSGVSPLVPGNGALVAEALK